MAIVARINKKSIDLKISTAINTTIQAFKPKLERAKREALGDFIREFHAHPVTHEIEGGPNAANISGTLGGYGNLFSFIGFEGGDNPIAVVQNYITDQVSSAIRIQHARGSKRWHLTVRTPSLEGLEAITPMPWAPGRSWLMGIHIGISGLGNYLFSDRASRYSSRSGAAIQTRNNLRGGRFNNAAYIIPLLQFLDRRMRVRLTQTLRKA